MCVTVYLTEIVRTALEVVLSQCQCQITRTSTVKKNSRNSNVKFTYFLYFVYIYVFSVLFSPINILLSHIYFG